MRFNRPALAHLTLAAAALVAAPAQAASVTAGFTQIAGSTWQVDLGVTAGAGQTVEAFSVYFDHAQATNLVVWCTASGWDSIVVQPDAALAADGLFDSLALLGGINPGDTLGGIAARFDWAAVAAPSLLTYSINDPLSFAPLESGTTLKTGAGTGGGTPIPEPATGLLALAGALAALALQRRSRH